MQRDLAPESLTLDAATAAILVSAPFLHVLPGVAGALVVGAKPGTAPPAVVWFQTAGVGAARGLWLRPSRPCGGRSRLHHQAPSVAGSLARGARRPTRPDARESACCPGIAVVAAGIVSPAKESTP
jgi:hypothetical protein